MDTCRNLPCKLSFETTRERLAAPKRQYLRRATLYLFGTVSHFTVDVSNDGYVRTADGTETPFGDYGDCMLSDDGFLSDDEAFHIWLDHEYPLPVSL